MSKKTATTPAAGTTSTEEPEISLTTDFVTDLEHDVAAEITTLATEIEAKFNELNLELTSFITNSHSITVTGIDHMNDITETEMMDLKYITKLENDVTFGGFSSCDMVTIDNDVLKPLNEFTQAMAADKGLKVDNKIWISCMQHHCALETNITDYFLKNPTKKLVKVVTCMRHHYEIKNMDLVARVTDMEFDYVINDNKTIPIFFYVLKNGL